MRKIGIVLAFVLLVTALIATASAPAYAGRTAKTWIPEYNVPILIPPFGPGVWAEATDPSVPPTMDWLVQASNTEPPTYEGEPQYSPFPKGRDAFVTQGSVGGTYGQVLRTPLYLATYCDITGPDGFHQHWDPQDTAPYWTGPHAWDEWWVSWLGGPAPELFNPRCQAGVYFNHLWLPVGPFPTEGTYHIVYGQYQLLPAVELVGYGDFRPYHYTPDDLNWEIEYDFHVE